MCCILTTFIHILLLSPYIDPSYPSLVTPVLLWAISAHFSLTFTYFFSISYWVQPVIPAWTWVCGYLLNHGEVMMNTGLKTMTLALQDALSLHSVLQFLMQISTRHDCNICSAMMQGHKLLLPSNVTNP